MFNHKPIPFQSTKTETNQQTKENKNKIAHTDR